MVYVTFGETTNAGIKASVINGLMLTTIVGYYI